MSARSDAQRSADVARAWADASTRAAEAARKWAEATEALADALIALERQERTQEPISPPTPRLDVFA